jgi:hypothetical protein
VGANPGPLSAGFYLFAEGLTLVAPLALLCYAALCPGALRLAVREARARAIVLALAALGAVVTALVGSLYYCFVEAAPGAGIPGPYRAVPVIVALIVLVAGTAGAALRTRAVGLVFE